MTEKELRQLYRLNQEYAADARRLAALQQGTEEFVEQQAALNWKRLYMLHEQLRAEAYIAGIPDSLTRILFRLRFVDGLPWRRVAEIAGGGHTEHSVRHQVNRYLQRARNC